MKKRVLISMAAALVLLLAGVSVYATAGSESDPLVSLSYLNETFLGTVSDKVQSMIQSRDASLKAELSAEISRAEKELAAQYGSTGGSNVPGSYTAPTFVVVTLEKGQSIIGEVGCELMLRVGSATCVADSTPGLIDTTDATTLGSGKSLTTNHLYMATIDGRGATATTSGAKILVRGDYTIR